MSAQPVDIHVFGRLFRVNCPAEQQEALQNAAQELDNRLLDLKTRTSVNNTEQLVFIAALNLCNELAQEKEKCDEYIQSMEQRIESLQQAIEQVLIEQQKTSNQ